MNRQQTSTVLKIVLAICIFMQGYTVTAQTWTVVSRLPLKDLCIDHNDRVWVINENNELMLWDETKFRKSIATATAVSTSNHDAPWFINSSYKIAEFEQGSDKTIVHNQDAYDIGASPFERHVWAVSTVPVQGGYELLKLNGEEWEVAINGATRVSVDQNGRPWFVNDRNELYYLDENDNVLLKGKNISDVTVGADNNVYAITTENKVAKFKNNRWYYEEVGAIAISATTYGTIWIINDEGMLAYLTL